MGASVVSGTTARRPAALAAGGRRALARTHRGVLVAAALSLGAALVHLQVTPSHWDVWWGYGTFFLLVGIGQALYAPAVIRWPTPAVLWFGIAGNLSVVGIYLLSRTNGIPWGPHAGRADAVGIGDFLTTAGEFVLVGMLGAALGPRARRWFMTLAAAAGVGLWVLRLTNQLM
jgi:hypothetical protein